MRIRLADSSGVKVILIPNLVSRSLPRRGTGSQVGRGAVVDWRSVLVSGREAVILTVGEGSDRCRNKLMTSCQRQKEQAGR